MAEIVLGLFGGAGATLLWELLLKPRRERRSVAEVLSAEVSLNLQLLAAAKIHAQPKKVPPDFELSTMVFEAVAAKLGELPPEVVGEVVFIYRYFRQLSEIPKTYVGHVDEYRRLLPDSSLRPQIDREIRTCVEVFNSYVDKAINRVNIVQPMLLASAFPWWSLRRWRREPSRQLTLEEMAERTVSAQHHRVIVAAEIARRAQHG